MRSCSDFVHFARVHVHVIVLVVDVVCLMLVLGARVVVHAVFVQFPWPNLCSKRYTLYRERKATEEKGTNMARSNCFLEQEVSRDTREREEETSIRCTKSESEPLRDMINKLSDERNLRDLHLKHYQMSTAQVKKRTTHLDILGTIYDFYQQLVKSGLCTEEFGDLTF